MELKKIYDNVQNISEAISSAMKVDVTVVDNHMERIAGTGRYREQIGLFVDEKSAFGYSIRKSKPYIIEDPGKNFVCDECENRNHCTEHAELCCPILIDQKAIGVIGLIAFDEKQKRRICDNLPNLLYFLSKMAELITSKYLEITKSEENQMLLKELEAVLDSVEHGIIATDEKGNILHYNKSVIKLMNLESTYLDQNNINCLIENISLEEVMKDPKSTNNKEFIYRNSNKIFRGYYDAKPICIENKNFGILFTFKNAKDILNIVNKVSMGTIMINMDDIKGESSCMKHLKEKALKAATSSSTILIQGDSGTGKELFARAIHFHSNRSNGPFVAINCAAIPEQLLESELFGYEPGAFTGAKKGGKTGKFELARKGTLFLDEIGDMPIHLQAKILRVLQERVVEKIGSEDGIPVDIRVIAATNRNLENKVKEGSFRGDLYYRLNVIPLNIPPLKNRKEDIAQLVSYGLDKFNEKLEKKIEKIDDEVMSLFLSYPWKGNVRELENAIEYAINMSTSKTITLEDLPNSIRVEPKEEEEFIIRTLDEIEKETIIKTLKVYKECLKPVDQAAIVLGISRATLYRKIKQYKLNESQNETKNI